MSFGDDDITEQAAATATSSGEDWQLENHTVWSERVNMIYLRRYLDSQYQDLELQDYQLQLLPLQVRSR